MKAKERFRRAGHQNTQFHDTKNYIKKLKGKFDSVILDVPCSGSGTYRRNPESKLEFDPAHFQETLFLQRDILSEGSGYLKSKGRLFYMTCSVFEEENTEQIHSFLRAKKSEFEMVYQESIWPERNKNDGFFLAVLEKK